MKRFFLFVLLAAGSSLIASAPKEKICLGEKHPLLVKFNKEMDDLEKMKSKAIILFKATDSAESLKKYRNSHLAVQEKYAQVERLAGELIDLKINTDRYVLSAVLNAIRWQKKFYHDVKVKLDEALAVAKK